MPGTKPIIKAKWALFGSGDGGMIDPEFSGGGAGMICCWTGLMVTSSPGLRLDFVRSLKHFAAGAAAG